MAEKTVEYATAEGNDYPEHERTYGGFVHATTVGTASVVALMILLAIGGVAGKWGIFWIGFIPLLVVTGLALRFASLAIWGPAVVALVALVLSVLTR